MLTKKNPIRWDAHACPPFKSGADLSFLERYKNAGVNFVSLNVGFDLISQNEVLRILNYFHEWISQHNDKYAIVKSVQDIITNQSTNKLSIAFDIEGCKILEEDLKIVSQLYKLGVKQMLFAYNKNTVAGGGCLDLDTGLTNFGKALINEMNDVGMIIDCSHVGYLTSMEIIELSKLPVVFSHSNPAKILKHPRNITDEQIIACAKKNGVIGINGIGIFLGENDVSTQKIVEHIDYVAQLVGSMHVGIGLDCTFDLAEVNNFVKNNTDIFPSQYGFNNVALAQPEQFSEIRELLIAKGYTENDINSILGENFLRVAKTVWK